MVEREDGDEQMERERELTICEIPKGRVRRREVRAETWHGEGGERGKGRTQ